MTRTNVNNRIVASPFALALLTTITFYSIVLVDCKSVIENEDKFHRIKSDIDIKNCNDNSESEFNVETILTKKFKPSYGYSALSILGIAVLACCIAAVCFDCFSTQAHLRVVQRTYVDLSDSPPSNMSSPPPSPSTPLDPTLVHFYSRNKANPNEDKVTVNSGTYGATSVTIPRDIIIIAPTATTPAVMVTMVTPITTPLKKDNQVQKEINDSIENNGSASADHLHPPKEWFGFD